MGALRKAQHLYDNAEPAPDDAMAEAQCTWVANNIEQLLRGADATFLIGDMTFGVTFEAFAEAVDEYAMGELGRDDCCKSVLGRLIIAGVRKCTADSASAATEIMACPDPKAMLEQIAHDLLVPFALPGVQAEREDATNDQ